MPVIFNHSCCDVIDIRTGVTHAKTHHPDTQEYFLRYIVHCFQITVSSCYLEIIIIKWNAFTGTCGNHRVT